MHSVQGVQHGEPRYWGSRVGFSSRFVFLGVNEGWDGMGCEGTGMGIGNTQQQNLHRSGPREVY
jgi:hypothetical protein